MRKQSLIRKQVGKLSIEDIIALEKAKNPNRSIVDILGKPGVSKQPVAKQAPRKFLSDEEKASRSALVDKALETPQQQYKRQVAEVLKSGESIASAGGVAAGDLKSRVDELLRA